MKYIKTDHYLIDYRKNTRAHVGTFYATKQIALAEKKIILSATNGKMPTATIVLEGQDLLSFKTYLAGNEAPISAGRFLNNDYEEMIFSADLPDKGIKVEGVTSKISDSLFVATKTVFISSTGEVGAIAQEIIHVISEDDFNKANGTADQ